MAKKKSKSKEPETDLFVVEVLTGGRWNFGRGWERLKAVRAADNAEDARINLDTYFEKVAKKRGYTSTWQGKEYRIARYVRKSVGKTIEAPKNPKKPTPAKR